MFLKSFDSCEAIYDRGYRGNAGRKISVLYEGEPWMLKFPESTRDFPGRQKPNNHLPSYTTSPVSEYIGSKIYASLGIPVHDVMLGRREGKLVVACRDFAVDATLLEFSQIKNMVDEDLLEGGNGSNEKRELLSNALTVIENAPVFGNIRERVRERLRELPSNSKVTSTVPWSWSGVKVVSAVTGLPSSPSRGSPVDFTMRVPLTVYSLPGMRSL